MRSQQKRTHADNYTHTHKLSSHLDLTICNMKCYGGAYVDLMYILHCAINTSPNYDYYESIYIFSRLVILFFLSLIIVFVIIVVVVVVVELDFNVECFKYMDIFAVLDVIMSINMNAARERRKKNRFATQRFLQIVLKVQRRLFFFNFFFQNVEWKQMDAAAMREPRYVTYNALPLSFSVIRLYYRLKIILNIFFVFFRFLYSMIL